MMIITSNVEVFDYFPLVVTFIIDSLTSDRLKPHEEESAEKQQKDEDDSSSM